MKPEFIRRLRGRAGFTLAETMIAVLILLMVSSIVAGGVPLAMNAYREVLSAANAETLLTSAVIRLRDELSEATDITVGSNSETITYTDANGIRTMLYSGGEGKSVMLEYTLEGAVRSRVMLSDGASEQNLYIDYGGTPDPAIVYSDGVIVIRNLSVKSGTRVLASLNELKIRVLADVVS